MASSSPDPTGGTAWPRVVCDLTVPILSRLWKGRFDSPERPALRRFLGPPHPPFGGEVVTPLRAVSGGERPGNQRLWAASGGGGWPVVLPSGEAGLAGRKPRLAATPQSDSSREFAFPRFLCAAPNANGLLCFFSGAGLARLRMCRKKNDILCSGL
jgi:hypothetical protein